MRLTAAQRKLISSLSSARKRRQEGLFVAEGIRSLKELMPVARLRYLVATTAWLEQNLAEISSAYGSELPDDVILVARNDEMERMSTMTTPQGGIGVFAIPAAGENLPRLGKGELALALDRIQDPGNLGTIIRVADWFGIRHIIASEDTVDVYNPKVLQSTMGAIARVRVYYCNLPEVLKEYAADGVDIYGTFLDGKNLYTTQLSPGGIIVMGNEGNGISAEVAACVGRRILIPPYPAEAETVESLNVGTATAVTVAEFRRRLLAGS